jgi:hypothetical protein
MVSIGYNNYLGMNIPYVDYGQGKGYIPVEKKVILGTASINWGSFGKTAATSAGTGLLERLGLSKKAASVAATDTKSASNLYPAAEDLTGSVTKKAATISPGSSFASKLPSLGTVAKVGAVGTAAIGGTYLAYTGVTTAGDWIKSLGPGTTKKDGAPGVPGTPGEPGANGTPGGPGFTNPYAGFWGNIGSGLGQGFAAPGVGTGAGIADIGAGIGGNIVPIALISGGLIIAEKYMKKGKGRTSRRKSKWI